MTKYGLNSSFQSASLHIILRREKLGTSLASLLASGLFEKRAQKKIYYVAMAVVMEMYSLVD